MVINPPKLNSVINVKIKITTNNEFDQSNDAVNADRDFAGVR